uniref:Uncharacterized protein n=1 Tax=Auxenochlorella protothecoides TaxID=3075 RepID=A0A1D2A4X7_AUXPR
MATSAKLPQVYLDQATAAVFTLAGAIVGLIQGAIVTLASHYPDIATKLKLDKVVPSTGKPSASSETVTSPEIEGSAPPPKVAARVEPAARIEHAIEEDAASDPPSPLKHASDDTEPPAAIPDVTTPKSVEKEPTTGSPAVAAKANLVDAGKTPQAVRTPELPAAAAYKGSKKAKSRNGAHKK